MNRVRTGGGRGASVPRPPGAGVPGWFGPGRRLGPPVALRQPSVRLGGRRGVWARRLCAESAWGRTVRLSVTCAIAQSMKAEGMPFARKHSTAWIVTLLFFTTGRSIEKVVRPFWKPSSMAAGF